MTLHKKFHCFPTCFFWRYAWICADTFKNGSFSIQTFTNTLSLNLLLILLFLIVWRRNFTNEYSSSSSASQPNFSINLAWKPVCFFYFLQALPKPCLHHFAACCLRSKMTLFSHARRIICLRSSMHCLGQHIISWACSANAG